MEALLLHLRKHTNTTLAQGVNGAQDQCINSTSTEEHCGAITQFLDLSWIYISERWAAAIAGIFTIIAIILSLNQIRNHFKHNRHREMRTYTVRILFMVPVFAAESFFALLFLELAPVMRMLREFYEAFALFSFTQFVLTYLDGAENLAVQLAEDPEDIGHLFPFCLVRAWPRGGKFLRNTLMGILQYIPVAIGITVVGLVCWYKDMYGDGEFDFTKAYLYCAFVQNASQIWALYCLVLLYEATKDRLAAINPLRKFLCIKLIVFFTWWQGVLIMSLSRIKLISKADAEIKSHWTSPTENLSDPIGEGLTNLIICIEMVGFAMAHQFAYPYSEFDDDEWREVTGRGSDQESHMNHIMDGMNLLDFVPKIDEYTRIGTIRSEADKERKQKAINCWSGDSTGVVTHHPDAVLYIAKYCICM
ncbi:hypothetical protein AAMO2058_000980100 [Amorphochlora amoebiformis]